MDLITALCVFLLAVVLLWAAWLSVLPIRRYRLHRWLVAPFRRKPRRPAPPPFCTEDAFDQLNRVWDERHCTTTTIHIPPPLPYKPVRDDAGQPLGEYPDISREQYAASKRTP